PPYLQTSRFRTLAHEYGYENADTLTSQIKRSYASITQMDKALAPLFKYLKDHDLSENTYLLLMGDNGWFTGEHIFTSKVLAYEESMRVPFFMKGPGIDPGTSEEMVLNIDIMPTILELAGLKIPENLHGKSLVPLLK